MYNKINFTRLYSSFKLRIFPSQVRYTYFLPIGNLPSCLGYQCFGSVYVFYGSGSRIFPQYGSGYRLFSIRIQIRIQVTTPFFKCNYKNFVGYLVFQLEKYLPVGILFNKECFFGRIFKIKMKIMKNYHKQWEFLQLNTPCCIRIRILSTDPDPGGDLNTDPPGSETMAKNQRYRILYINARQESQDKQ